MNGSKERSDRWEGSGNSIGVEDANEWFGGEGTL